MKKYIILACLSMAATIAVSACSSSDEARRKNNRSRQSDTQPGDNTRPKEKVILFPQVLRTEPDRSYLDLGPVVVSTSNRGGIEKETVLLDIGKRIGADAFILDEHKITEAYPIQRVAMRRYMDAYSGDVFEVTTYVYRGSSTGGAQGPTSEQGFYRAIRFVEGEPGPCKLDLPELGQEAELLRDAPTLREQLRRLSVIFTRGLLDVESFRKARKSCLDQIPVVN